MRGIRDKRTDTFYPIPEGMSDEEAKAAYRAGQLQPEATAPAQIAKSPSFTERVEARAKQGAPLPFTTEGLSSLLGYADPYTANLASKLPAAVLPQTKTALMTDLLSMALGGAPKLAASAAPLSRWAMRGARVGIPTAGAAATAAVTGEEPPGAAAAKAAVATGLGEGVSKAGEVLTRKFGGAGIDRLDVRNLAGALEPIVPSSQAHLREAAQRGPGTLSQVLREGILPENLSAAYRADLDTIFRLAQQSRHGGGMIPPGGGPPMPLVNVPSLNLRDTPLPTALEAFRQSRRAGWLPSGMERTGTSAGAAQQIRQEAGRELTRELTGFSQRAADAFTDANQRYFLGKEIERALGPKAAPLAESRRIFESGFDADALRRVWESGHAARLRRTLPPDQFAALEDAIYRGAPQAALRRDVPQGAGPMPTGARVVTHGPGFWAGLHERLKAPPKYIGDIPRAYRLGGFPAWPVAVPAENSIEALMQRSTAPQP